MKISAYLLVLALSSNSCSAGKQEAPSPAPQDTGIVNPVLDRDFPDPTVIKAGEKYYAYATNTHWDGKWFNIQVASSTDLQHWTVEGDALPQKPSWAHTTQEFWAPQAMYDSSLKKYVLFYSAESDEPGINKCLAVAFADKPEGPFTDKGTPLRCGAGFANIDIMAFKDPVSGKKFIYWGSDHKPLLVQEMKEDWTAFKEGSTPKEIVQPSNAPYSRLVEGPWVDYYDGKYYLYYSGDNCCGDNANYAVMIARSDNPTGPFTLLGEANGSGNSVILEKNDTWLAPGHNSIFRDAKGDTWIAYHAIRRKARGPRVMCLSRVIYKDGWPEIQLK